MADDGRADAGVLLVHGIGEQREGETLQSAISAFLEWAESQFGAGKVRLESTCLKPSLQFSGEPASAWLKAGEQDASRRLLFAESWWTRQFDAPDAGAVGRWLLTSGSWMAIRYMAEAARRSLRQIPGLRHSDSVSILAAYAGVPAAILLVFPVQLIILLALLLSALPLPKVESIAKRILKFISEVLGDSYIYASDSVATDAILSKIQKDLAWLRSRCKRVTILAHSQGAALTFSLLKEHAELRDSMTVLTYGAGIKKLVEMSTVVRRHGMSVMVSSSIWLYTLLFFAALSIAGHDFVRAIAALGSHQAPVGDQIAGLAWTYIFVYVIACGTLAMVAMPDPGDYAPLKGDLLTICEEVRWTDLFASADPVPAGPLIDGLSRNPAGWYTAGDHFHSSEVVNEGVLAFDHTSYWSSGGDFVPKVAFWLNSWAGLGWNVSAAPIFAAARNRRWRVRLRTLVRWSAMALAIVMLFWLRDQWYGALESLLRIYALPSLTAAYPLLSAKFVLASATIYTLGIALHLGLAMLLLQFFTMPFWRVWDAASAKPGGRAQLVKSIAAFLAYLGSSAGVIWVAVDIIWRQTYSLDWSRLVPRVSHPDDTNMLIALEILIGATLIGWLVSRKR